jgi:hypothetical protein
MHTGIVPVLLEIAWSPALGTAALTLNKTSTNTAVYGEPFVKRHGLFCMTVASRHGVVQVA